jgi:hypothetical protein
MKQFFNFFCIVAFFWTHTAQPCLGYTSIIEPYAQIWQEECIKNLTLHEIVTLSDMLLLSYQIVHASCAMAIAKLEIQSELFNIITLSINDSIDARLQAQNNDFSTIKHLISIIEQSQAEIKIACDTLKNFGPLVINIKPIPIQMFIAHVKTIILKWATTQQETLDSLSNLHNKFLTSSQYFYHLQDIFQTITTKETIEQTYLMNGANTLHALYGAIEHIIAEFTITRYKSIESFQSLLTAYFKIHYEILYNCIQQEMLKKEECTYQLPCKILATSHHQLPLPENFFI